MRLAGEREELAVVADQVGAPTSAALVADVTASCVALATESRGRDRWGVYHVVAAGYTSWHAYATYIVETAGAIGIPLRLSAHAIRPVSSVEYGAPARRPLNSWLATDKLKATFGLAMPDWKVGMKDLVAQLCAGEAQ